MNPDTKKYNDALSPGDRAIGRLLATEIGRGLPKAENRVREGTFKAAEARFAAADQVDATKLQARLKEARDIQWDYKNIVRRKGKLVRLK